MSSVASRRHTATALVMVLLLLAGCARAVEPPAPANSGLLEAGSAQARAALAGTPGKPIVVNLWASWCAPCRDEAPTLAAAARRYAGRVSFVGVDYQDSPDDARKFMAAFGLPFPSVNDRTGQIANTLGLRGIPVTAVFDERGTEVFRRVGAITQSELVAALEDVLAP